MRWLTRDRFSFLDACIIAAATVYLSQGRILAWLITMVVGGILSTILAVAVKTPE